MECKFDTESHMKTLHHELNKINTKMLSNEKNEKLIERKGIRLLTYNIFLRPPPIKNNEDDYKNERIEDFCKVINDFDIICLQEMFGTYNSRKHELIRAANLQGFFFYVDTPTPSFISKYMVDGGLLILSRFPIVESCFYPYTYGVLSDSLAEKGILYAKIKLGDNYLHLMTTHLQASYFDSTDYHWNVSWDARYDQLHEVNNIVREILKHYYTYQIDKVLFVGDFNVDAQKYKFKKPVLNKLNFRKK
jgi:sphingomyelin phosphodiesterase